MNIQVTVNCHKSGEYPCIRIWLDGHVFADSKTHMDQQSFGVLCNVAPGKHTLVIEHYDKKDSDTWCDENGKITADRALEIVGLTIDGFEVPRNVIFSKNFYPNWPEHFENPPEYITDNNWLGFNGRWVFDFDYPFDSTYYGYFWEIEKEANTKFQKTDVDTKEDYFEAYGLKIKVDQNFSFTLTDLKKLIEENE